MGWGQSGSLRCLYGVVLWGKALVTLFLVMPRSCPYARVFPAHTCQLAGCFSVLFSHVASVTVYVVLATVHVCLLSKQCV